jgi:hypothetical protein
MPLNRRFERRIKGSATSVVASSFELEKQIIKTYRQDLRDFINNNEIRILAGEKVEFSKQPDFIDLNVIY